MSPFRKIHVIRLCIRLSVTIVESLQVVQAESYGISVKYELSPQEAEYALLTLKDLLATVQIQSVNVYDEKTQCLNILSIAGL